MGPLSLALPIALASGLLALLGVSDAPAVEPRGKGLQDVAVRVNLSGTETADYTRREVDDDECYSRETTTTHISQQTSFESTKTKHGDVYHNPNQGPGSQISAQMAGRVNVDRQAQSEREVVSGSCSANPGQVVERGPNSNVETSGCGPRTLKQELDLSSSPPNQRSLSAFGWAPSEGDYPACGDQVYDIDELDPLPAIGPPTVEPKLNALRAGRRKQVKFEYQDTITLHREDPSEYFGPTVIEDTVIDLRWKAKVTRK